MEPICWFFCFKVDYLFSLHTDEQLLVHVCVLTEIDEMHFFSSCTCVSGSIFVQDCTFFGLCFHMVDMFESNLCQWIHVLYKYVFSELESTFSVCNPNAGININSRWFNAPLFFFITKQCTLIQVMCIWNIK